MKRLRFLCMGGFAVVLFAFGFVLFAGSGAQAATPYSQTLDNTTTGRFSAPGWGVSSYSSTRLGADYRYVKPGGAQQPAMYKFKVPQAAGYSVFARMPSNAGYNGRVWVGISTASGLQWKTVDQRKNGGRWVKLGFFRLNAGDANIVRVSQNSNASGHIIADGMKIIQGDVASATTTSGTTSGSGSAAVTGADVIREAKTWLGVPYKYGGTSRDGVDCSGLTYSVYRALGIGLPRTASDQYNSGPGTKVATNDLRAGYLVFGNAGGSGIQHVGIITGDGRMIHSPQPGTVVRYDPLPASWYNILGVKRIVPAS